MNKTHYKESLAKTELAIARIYCIRCRVQVYIYIYIYIYIYK